jgi:hypothetical protein
LYLPLGGDSHSTLDLGAPVFTPTLPASASTSVTSTTSDIGSDQAAGAAQPAIPLSAPTKVEATSPSKNPFGSAGAGAAQPPIPLSVPTKVEVTSGDGGKSAQTVANVFAFTSGIGKDEIAKTGNPFSAIPASNTVSVDGIKSAFSGGTC